MDNKKHVWMVATGTLNPFEKEGRLTWKLLKGLDGLVSIRSNYPFGTLLLFNSENNANGAMNLMEAQGFQCERDICRGRINGDALEMLEYIEEE